MGDLATQALLKEIRSINKGFSKSSSSPTRYFVGNDSVDGSGAHAIIRGLRAISDFEHEFQMALINRKLAKTVETVFLMPSEEYSYLSSTIIKEVARHGGALTEVLHPEVARRLNRSYQESQIMKLAARVSRIAPSPTLAMAATAKAMAAQGLDIVDFSTGEPDFDTPEPVKAAAEAAIRAGFTKYTPSSGIDELRGAIVEKLSAELGVRYEKSQVLVSCGAKHSLYNLAEALLEAGDEIIIPTPYWVSYSDHKLHFQGQHRAQALAGSHEQIPNLARQHLFLLPAGSTRSGADLKQRNLARGQHYLFRHGWSRQLGIEV